MNEPRDLDELERAREMPTCPAPPDEPSAPMLPDLLARRLDAIDKRITDGLHDLANHLQAIKFDLHVALRQMQSNSRAVGELAARVTALEEERSGASNGA